MKKIIILLLMISLFLIGCEVRDGIPEEIEVPSTGAECSIDSDCITGGCSGTICQSKDTEPIFTTCEWREDYRCYTLINCGCDNGKCEWQKTNEFDGCVEKARESPDIIV